MKIFDCFTFFNELDVLEIRLNELKDVVDYFVLVESDVTHSGKKKNLIFRENIERFDGFLDRIIYVKASNMPTGPDAWKRENHQRNEILRGLGSAKPEDLIIISDVDEIPKASEVERIASMVPEEIIALRMRFFTLRLNYLLLNGPAVHQAWSAALRFQRLGTPQEIRNDITRLNVKKRTRNKFIEISEAGWHFSSMGGDEQVRTKLAAYAHQEGNVPSIVDNIDVAGALTRGLDVFGRPDYFWSVAPVSVVCPEYVVNNTERYQHLIAPDVTLESVFSKAIAGAAYQATAKLPRHIVERMAFKLLNRPRF